MWIVPAADGFPHQQHICGFRCLTPLMRNSRPNKTRSDNDNHHQRMGSQMLMMLMALTGEYASLLAKHNIVIANYSSWEPIVFPPDTAAYLLAQASLSVYEVSDTSHFALAWCQAMGALPNDDIQIRVRLGNTVIVRLAQGLTPGPLLCPIIGT